MTNDSTLSRGPIPHPPSGIAFESASARHYCDPTRAENASGLFDEIR